MKEEPHCALCNDGIAIAEAQRRFMRAMKENVRLAETAMKQQMEIDRLNNELTDRRL